MYKYNIYIGKFDKDLKFQTLTDKQFLDTIDYVLDLFGINCYTIYNTTGVYKHKDSTIINEPSLIVETIDKVDFKDGYLKRIKFKLEQSLNQETVLITKQEIQVL